MKSREKQPELAIRRMIAGDSEPRGRSSSRANLEELLRLAIHLDDPDRDLLIAVYNDGIPVRRLGRMLGVRSQATLARRIRRALDRLANPLFRKVLGSRNRWSAERHAVAEQVWLRGRTNRQAAHALNLSLHRVRQHVAAIKAVLAERTDSIDTHPRMKAGTS